MIKRTIITAIIATMNISFSAAQVFDIPEKEFIDTLDIEIVDGDPTIPVKVNNRTCRFLFDTGSNAIYISRADFPDIKLTGDSTNVVGFESGRRANAIIEKLQIGSLKFKSIPTIIHKTTATNFDGIIGYNLLQAGLVAKLQMRDKKLILSNNLKAFDKEKGLRIKLLKEYNYPIFYTEPLSGIKTTTMFDTGNPYDFSLSKYSWENYWKTCNGHIPGGITKQIVWCNFQTLPKYFWKEVGEETFFRFDNIKLKGISFRQVTGHLVNVPFSNIGISFCYDFDVIINAPRNELIFLTDKKEIYPETSGANFRLFSYYGETQQRISSLNPETELYKSGARFGDIIKEIDGIIIDSSETLTKVTRGKKTIHMKLTNKKGEKIEADISKY